MPSSDPAIRNLLIKRIKEGGRPLPLTVLDIGMGAGEYGNALKSLYPAIQMVGLEIFSGYVRPDWGYSRIYHKVFVEDMRVFDYGKTDANLVIAGDVLEHVVKEEAIKVVGRLKDYYPWILAAIPIINYPQGPDNEFGNPHEEHKHQWNIEEVERDLGLQFINNSAVCGLFEWRKDE